MIRELLSVFRGGSRPLEAMTENFRMMLGLALDNTLDAGRLLFEQELKAEDRSAIYEQDI